MYSVVIIIVTCCVVIIVMWVVVIILMGNIYDKSFEIVSIPQVTFYYGKQLF